MKLEIKQILIISFLLLLSATTFGNENSDDSFDFSSLAPSSAYFGYVFNRIASETAATRSSVRYANYIETCLRREISIKNATKHLESMKAELRKGRLPRLAIRALARSAALLGAFMIGYDVGEYLNEHTNIGQHVTFVGENTGAFYLMMGVENKYYDLEEYLLLSTKEMIALDDGYDFYDIAP